MYYVFSYPHYFCTRFLTLYAEIIGVQLCLGLALG